MNTIIKTNSFEPIIAACALLTSDDCVLFDIDEVIIHLQDAVLQDSERRTLMNNILYPIDYKGPPYHSATIWPQADIQLVDEQIKELFLLLQSKNIPHMGLTAGWAGQLGIHKNYHTIRASRLAKLGIIFNHAVLNNEGIIFEDMSNYDRHPILYKNILFCCRIPKHLVFERCVVATGIKPDRIVFIDDTLENLENLADWCRQNAIEFQGFHYTKANTIKKEFSQQRALFQVNYLKTHNIWLSDKQTDEAMQSTSKAFDR